MSATPPVIFAEGFRRVIRLRRGYGLLVAVMYSAPMHLEAQAAAAPALATGSLWQVAPANHDLRVLAERRFDAATGLRASTVFAMAVDRNGVPWLGADDGLYSYAGGQWRREVLPDDFANHQVRSVWFSDDGTRWVGTRRGLLQRPRGGRWRVFNESDGLQGAVVFSLGETRAIDGTRRVVAGTSRGVSWFNGSRFVPLTLPVGFDPLGIMVASAAASDGQAELWVASALGKVARYSQGTWRVFAREQGFTSPDAQFLLPVPERNGVRLYVVGLDGVFALQRRDEGDRFVLMPGSPRGAYRVEQVQSGDGTDELWVGAQNGRIYRWRDGIWSLVPTSISERHGTITLLKSMSGHGGGTAVYASSRSGYLVRLSYGVAGTLSLSTDTAASYINAVYAERVSGARDDLWLGTQDRGLMHVAATGAVRQFASNSGPVKAVTAISRESLAPPGAATTSTAITVVADSVPWHVSNGRLERFDAGLDGARVYQVRRMSLPNGTDALLAATSTGLQQWSGVAWGAVVRNGVPVVQGPVTSLAMGEERGQSVLYMGGPHIVRVMRGTAVAVESLPAAAVTGVGTGVVRRICTSAIGGQTRVMALDSDRGILWRQSTGTAWQVLPAHLRRVLTNLGATDLTCLNDGRIAVATFSGLAVFDFSAPEPDKWRVATQVSDADGLPASGVVSIAASSARDLVWVGTTFGVGIVDLSRASQLPPARLTMRLTSESRRRLVNDGDVLGPDENDVHVDPMLLTFHREELTRFRVRLTGRAAWPSLGADVVDGPEDGEWLDVPNRYYHDLTPGNYQLTVWAYDWAGREYGPMQRSFSVLTPNWRTWPARVIYALWVVLLLTIGYRWRVRTIREGGEQLLLSERRARDSERRFRAIFEQALDGHLLLEDGKVQAANAVAARLFNVATPDALLQRALHELLGASSPVASALTPVETTIVSHEQATPVQYTVTDVPSASRMLQHVVVRDLTEVRKAEAERAWFQAQVREAQKLESLGTLAGGVAHDFNNLLGVIRGNAELARTALKRGRNNDDNLGAILDASDRARDIVRQILTFSRRSTPTREYVNLSRLVLDLQPLLRRMVPRTVQLVIEGAEESHLMMGDPTQLQQLLLNLVSNAEYALRSKTDGVITIALSARDVPAGQPAPSGPVVVLQVRDTGPGMSEEVRSRIFEPFFTTKPTGEGTGLGMAVVHGIVVSHEGRAEVSSEEGQGAVFEIRFPRAVIEGLWDDDLDPDLLLDDDADALDPHISGELALPPGATVSGVPAMDMDMDVLENSPYAGTSVVVVDDEPAVAEVVERALQHYGHVVHTFHSPEQALHFIQEQPSSVDLLITDQTMPGMTGDMLAEAVHVLRGELPVLILTGFSHRLTPERIAAAGAHAVLLKPVELAVLKQRVDDALSTSQRR